MFIWCQQNSEQQSCNRCKPIKQSIMQYIAVSCTNIQQCQCYSCQFRLIHLNNLNVTCIVSCQSKPFPAIRCHMNSRISIKKTIP
uniref:Uncharacterized protein n=1 Tax=Arundo donax TaxID=35708 RepID=A0A0A9E2B1_ARUDO